MLSSAKRFLSAYNKIDKQLREVNSSDIYESFSQLVRKSSTKSLVIKKYASELLDYAQLRNAIVHSSTDEMVIAEPHESVTEQIEQICRLLCTPPTALVYAHKPFIVKSSQKLRNTINLMAASNYSNVPVVEDGKIISVITNKMIVEAIAACKNKSYTQFLTETRVCDIITSDDKHYAIMESGATIDAVLDKFSQFRSLAIILLTADGTQNGFIDGVLTISDISILNAVMDKY